MCTVPSSDRRRRFLQYNFMDPGWGGAEFPTGGRPPGSPAGAGAENADEYVTYFDFWTRTQF